MAECSILAGFGCISVRFSLDWSYFSTGLVLFSSDYPTLRAWFGLASEVGLS